MRPIAYIHTDLPEKFGVPKQCGLVEGLKGRIVFEPEFRVREAFRGLDGFSHIWVIWEFSKSAAKSSKDGGDGSICSESCPETQPGHNSEDRSGSDSGWDWSPTVRPPSLGGNIRMGVFATRSPFRPNNIGLSSLRLEGIDLDDPEGPVLHVSGIDMIDGTPVFDIKPYIPYSDSHPDAEVGFTKEAKDQHLEISFPDDLLERVPEEKREALFGVLSLNPVPAYQKEPGRIYGMKYADMNIRFRIEDETVYVVDVRRSSS